jgi:hypothetical protein
LQIATTGTFKDSVHNGTRISDGEPVQQFRCLVPSADRLAADIATSSGAEAPVLIPA